MKKFAAVCMALALSFALCACEPTPIEPAVTPTAPSAESPAATESIDDETVTVSNIKELVNAIGSDTHILLEAGTYNFANLYKGDVSNDHVQVAPELDRTCPCYITGVSNLTIEPIPGAEAEIITDSANNVVLEFSYCTDITLKNLTCGHDVEPGYCKGDVIKLNRCANVSIDNCRLYGCGVYGINAYQSSELDITDTEIYSCSKGIVSLNGTDNVTFDCCSFYDSCCDHYFSIYDSTEVLFFNTEIYDNQAFGDDCMLIDDVSEVTFECCPFHDNTPQPDPRSYPGTTFDYCGFIETQEHIGYVRVSESMENSNIILLSINEVVWVSWTEVELMEQYDISYDDMADDYYLVDEDEEYYPFMAYKNETTFAILKPDPQYGFAVTTEVDYSEFLAALEPYGSGELLVAFTLDEDADTATPSISYIGEKYVP